MYCHFRKLYLWFPTDSEQNCDILNSSNSTEHFSGRVCSTVCRKQRWYVPDVHVLYWLVNMFYIHEFHENAAVLRGEE